MRHLWPAGLLVLALLASPLSAQVGGTADQPLFKRVKPPAAGATRRILVQIDPVEQARVLAAGIDAARLRKEQGAAVVAEAASTEPSGQPPTQPSTRTSDVLDW